MRAFEAALGPPAMTADEDEAALETAAGKDSA